MERNAFWALIDGARAEAKVGHTHVSEKLVRKLEALSPAEIIAFDAILQAYLSALRREDLWAAAYAIRGGMSDDSFDYFRGWLVGRGEAALLAAIRDPESLASIAVEHDPRDERMLSVARVAYEERTGKPLAMDGKFVLSTSDWPADRIPDGEEWTDDLYRRTYPALFARFIAPHASSTAEDVEGSITNDRFWEIIAEARRSRPYDSAIAVVDSLVSFLDTAEMTEVVGFARWLRAWNRALLERRDLRGAAAVLLNAAGSDDDEHLGFRGWLLSQGREAMEAALRDLDALADVMPDDATSLPTMIFVTQKRLGLGFRLPDSDSDSDSTTNLDRASWAADWSAQEDDPRARLPRLTARADAASKQYSQRYRDEMGVELLRQAKVAKQNGDARGAIAILDRAVALEPHVGNVQVERAIMLLELATPDDVEAARRDLDEAIVRQPTNARALWERSKLRAKTTDDATAARADARSAAENGSREAAAWLASPAGSGVPKRVRHKKFGEGNVVAVEQTPEGQKLEIDFEVGGKKKLLASFVEVIE